MINYSSVEETLNNEGYFIKGFSGYSMYPTFNKNDLLVIEKTDDIKLYDVVLYRNKNKYIAHRIVDIKEGYYVIRGDNTTVDEIVSRKDILAKISSIIRKKQVINLDPNENIRCYQRSLKTLKYRKLKTKIRKILKHAKNLS